MKVTYDAEVDILNIELRDVPIAESDEQLPGFIFDYDASGEIVGMEIMNASRRVTDAQAFAAKTATAVSPAAKAAG